MIQTPLVQGMGKRWFIKNVSCAIGLGIILAEGFYRFVSLPHAKKRDQYYAERGVTYQKPF